jgi:hypothetical protein
MVGSYYLPHEVTEELHWAYSGNVTHDFIGTAV